MIIPNIEIKDGLYELGNTSRFEFIDATGRQLVCYLEQDEYFRFAIQDEGRTLKLIKVKTHERAGQEPKKYSVERRKQQR